MTNELLTLARAVLARNNSIARDSAWDTRGTAAKALSHRGPSHGTAKTVENQCDRATVPVSQAIGDGTVGQSEKSGTARGTLAGQPYSGVVVVLRSKCPELIDCDRWQQATRDANAFLATWGAQAHALGWTVRELFGLHPIPTRPAPSYQRLSRYDATGLVWLLRGRPVIALTETKAAIQSAGAVVTYRKTNKPALGPLGDSLDDFGAVT